MGIDYTDTWNYTLETLDSVASFVGREDYDRILNTHLKNTKTNANTQGIYQTLCLVSIEDRKCQPQPVRS